MIRESEQNGKGEDWCSVTLAPISSAWRQYRALRRGDSGETRLRAEALQRAGATRRRVSERQPLWKCCVSQSPHMTEQGIVGDGCSADLIIWFNAKAFLFGLGDCLINGLAFR